MQNKIAVIGDQLKIDSYNNIKGFINKFFKFNKRRFKMDGFLSVDINKLHKYAEKNIKKSLTTNDGDFKFSFNAFHYELKNFITDYNEVLQNMVSKLMWKHIKIKNFNQEIINYRKFNLFFDFNENINEKVKINFNGSYSGLDWINGYGWFKIKSELPDEEVLILLNEIVLEEYLLFLEKLPLFLNGDISLFERHWEMGNTNFHFKMFNNRFECSSSVFGNNLTSLNRYINKFNGELRNINSLKNNFWRFNLFDLMDKFIQEIKNSLKDIDPSYFEQVIDKNGLIEVKLIDTDWSGIVFCNRVFSIENFKKELSKMIDEDYNSTILRNFLK